MVKINDLNPRPEDSLKKLVARIDNGQTTAYGNKVAGPDESATFFTASGESYTINGEKIGEYNARLDAGEKAIAEAKESLAEAEQNIIDASARIEETTTTLAEQETRLHDAENLAAETGKNLDALDERLSGEVSSAVESIEAVRAEAESAARNAGLALTSANGKSTNYYTVQEPASAKTGDLWFTEGSIKTYDGKGWVSYKDPEIAEVRKTVQTSAGNKVHYQVDEPVGEKVGDVWFDVDDGYRMRHWNGARWADAPLGTEAIADAAITNAKISELNAGKITSGEIDAARIGANSITADKLVVGTGDNLFIDPGFDTRAPGVGTANYEQGGGKGINGGNAFAIPAGTTQRGYYIGASSTNAHYAIPIRPGVKYRVSAWVKTDGAVVQAPANASLYVRFINSKTGVWGFGNQSTATTTGFGGNQWVQLSSVFEQKPGDTYDRIAVGFYANGSFDGTIYFANPSVVPMTSAVTIEDGTITADSGIVASLDAGKITAGTLDAARIGANTITADKLIIGRGENIIPNGNGEAPHGFEQFEYFTDPDITGGAPGVFALTGRKTVFTSQFPARGGTYRFTLDAKAEIEGTRFYAQIRPLNQNNGLATTSSPYAFTNQIIPNGTWGTYTGEVTLPNNTTQADVAIYSMHSNGAQNPTAKIYYRNFRMEEKRDGGLIVDGSITGNKIAAESVAARVGDFVKVKAENVEVTGDLSARVVNSMTANTKKLVVTDEAIMAHTTLIGDTTADYLNVNKKLSARDAIIDGTLDVAQLNVTEDLSAAVVRSMSAESKNLVVTDEAIMNKATVVENIVTPELVTKKVSSALVTGDTIQTNPEPERGIKINTTGYKAYNDTGTLTVNLDGKDNLIVGNLTTSEKDGAGIRIVQTGTVAGIDLYPAEKNSIAPDNHGGIWWEGNARGSLQGLYLAGTRNRLTQDTDPSVRLMPGVGIGFGGRFARESPAFKADVETVSSVDAGGWTTIKKTFLTPMTTGASVMVFISPINANGCECSIGIKRADTTGFEAVVKNEAPRATGTQWIKWMAVAI